VAKDEHEEGGSKASLLQTVAAVIAGMIAVKLATYLVTTMWGLVTREDPPEVDEPAPAGKKAAWIALFGAATGAARQAARDAVKGPGTGAT
jgi:hypothetical protein